MTNILYACKKENMPPDAGNHNKTGQLPAEGSLRTESRVTDDPIGSEECVRRFWLCYSAVSNCSAAVESLRSSLCSDQD